MKDPDKDKESNKLSEEELLALLEELKKHKKPKRVSVSLGFLLHRSYVIHMLMSLGINLIIAAVVFGLAIGIGQPLVEVNVIGFVLAIMLLTLIENFVKLLMFKYFARIMLLSIGLLSVMVQILILYVIDLILVEGFHFAQIENLIIFAFIFSSFRLIISMYLRRWLYGEKIVFFRR